MHKYRTKLQLAVLKINKAKGVNYAGKKSNSNRSSPYILVVGGRDMEAKTASIRLRNGEQTADVPLETIIAQIQNKIATRSLEN